MRNLTGRFLAACLVMATGFAAGCGGGAAAPPPVTVSIAPSGSPAIDQGQALTLSATVANDATNAGVAWSLNGVGTLSGSTISSVTYTAPATVAAASTATVTAASVAKATQAAAVNISVNPPPAVTTATLAAGSVNTAYKATLAASGGAGALAWSLPSGSTLPTGLTLSSNGVISGTVAAPVTAAFTVQVTDSSAVKPLAATSGTLSLTINPAPLAITAPTLANGIQGTAYTPVTVAATGGTGALAWSATGLPAGLSIAAATGSISGTPTTPGTYSSVVITATDSGAGAFQQTQSTAALALTVYPTLNVGALAAITAVQNVTAVSATASATGGAGADTWSATGLPAGVSIAAGSGVLSGTPTASGSFTATITAKDAGTPQQTASATLALTVIAQLAVTAPSLANAVQGTAYTSAAFTSTGGSGAITWSATGLPAGLAIGASTGIITGTATTAGTSASVVVTATDSGAGALQQVKATAALSLTVIPTLALTTASLPAGTYGTAYTTTLAASGGVGPYTWSSTALPTGLSLNASTGVLSGTPTATNAGTVSFTVTDAGTPQQTQTAPLTLTINPGTPLVTTASIPAATVNVPYSQTLSYDPQGQPGPATWTVSAGSVPAPFSLSASGVLSGTPTVSGGPFSFSVTATVNGVPSASQALVLNVYSALTVTSSATPPAATVGSAYSFTLQAAGGSGSGYTWSLLSGTLPPGLSALPSGGLISFTPTTAGNYNFTVQVTDSGSHTASQTITLVVNPAPPAITTTSLPNGNVAVAYNQQLAYNYGGSGLPTWNITGGGASLTALGLAMNSTGDITGAPGTPGSASFTVTVTVNTQTSSPQTLTINVVNNPAVTTSSLPPAYINTAYSTTLVASGGSGNGYTWTVTSGQATLTQLNLSLSSAGVLSGTPSAAGSGSVTFQVKDSGGLTGTATLTVAAYAALALPTANPSSLPAATINTPYTGAITATGGVPSYTWYLNGVALPTDGSQTAVSNGLSVSNTGGNTLTVTGTPTTSTTVNLPVSIKDSVGTSVGPVAYTVAASTTYSVSGNVSLSTPCGNSAPLSGITLTISGSNATTTSDNSGNFSFSGLANGSYTITPSISGPSAAFYPASQSVTINGANGTFAAFSADLGYTVSGTVSYSGAQTGRVYLTLNSANCGSSAVVGTSISSPGPYTIRGVPPGSYTLQAWMDNLGSGHLNASNPIGTSAANLTTANVTGANVTLADPAAVTLASAPKLQGVSGFNSGALVQFKTLVNSNNLELPTSYTLQWSSTSAFTAIAGSKNFVAGGNGGAQVWMLHGLTDGSAYYFRLFATAGSSTSPPSAVFGPVTIGAPTGGNTITGTVTFPGTATGPLYTGLYDMNSGAFYGQYIASPVSPQPFSVQVPNGSNYFQVAILDQNNNGQVDAGDIANVKQGSNTSLAISGPAALPTLTLSGANATAAVTTQNNQLTSGSGTTQSYALNFKISDGIKLPVAATLVSGPNVLAPVDIGICTTCGRPLQYSVNLNAVAPKVGDTYSLLVTYSDGTSETLQASVSAVLTAFATNLSPTVGTVTTTTPTFTWTDPANASSYTYSFYLNDSNGNTIWQIPGNNSNSNGFDSSITSITWGTDPTGGGSTPSVGSLTSGITYTWTIQATDSNGNETITQTTFQP